MTPRGLTAKGAATRQRIVEAAADRVLERGVGATTLEDVRVDTSTSKSQLFHYFPEGKHELVRAIVACQGDRVLDAQRPAIDRLDTWESWARWRDLVVAHYREHNGNQGCPIGSLAAEVAAEDVALRSQIAAYLTTWRELLAQGVERLRASGLVRRDVDAGAMAVSLLAAIQGGLLLSRAAGDLSPLETALDAALAHLKDQAASEPIAV